VILAVAAPVKAAFHDTDNDTDTDILARMSVSLLVSVSWNAAFRPLLKLCCQFIVSLSKFHEHVTHDLLQTC